MAAALLFMLTAGLFLSSWVSLLSARAQQVSYLEDASRRRLSVESSRLLSWQCAEEKAFDPGGDLAGGQDGILGASAGGTSTFDGWADLNVFTSTTTPGAMTTVFPYNYTGLRSSTAFLTTERLRRPSSLTAVDDFNNYLFLKTYPPFLAGEIFVVCRKPDSAITEIDVAANTASHNAQWIVQGRSVVRHPLSLFARTTPSPLQLPLRSRSLYVQSHDPYGARLVCGTDLNGARMLPSNLSAVPSTTGPVSDDDAQQFGGYLNVVRNDHNPDNSIWHFMDREKAAGRSDFASIEVFSKSASATGPWWMEEQGDPTYKPPNWPSGYPPRLRVLVIQLNDPNLPHMRIQGVVDQIIFKGQTSGAQFDNAGAMTPVMFTLVPAGDNGPSVRDIRFERENNRRIVLGVNNWNAAPLDISWEADPISGAEHRWRCAFINEYHTVMVNLPVNVTRTVRWIGGVMTNWTFKRRASGGTNASRLTFTADSDPSVPAGTPSGPAFATFLPRDGWLESYFFPVPPP